MFPSKLFGLPMDKNRLLWASRRGMLELDLILQPFVESNYDSLSEQDKLRFEVLLEIEDQQLFMWLMKREQPVDPEMQRIVTIIHESRSKSV
jgi:antitoxin CptB